jgi:hypothetical protein
MFANLNS